MHETQEEAMAREVRAIDQERLDAYFEKRGLARATNEKATTDPETLKDFHTFIGLRGEAELTDRQLRSYVSLKAGRTSSGEATNMTAKRSERGFSGVAMTWMLETLL